MRHVKTVFYVYQRSKMIQNGTPQNLSLIHIWPEITDFNVLQKFQRRGIGNRILDTAEQLAARTSGQVVLGVGLHSGYGSAQRLYVKRGYVPDGSGVWYEDGPLGQYESCNNDDNLVLYLSKKLQKRELRQLKEEELAPQLFAYFDRFQPVEWCWRKIDGNWIIKDVPFTERWGEAEYLELTECLMRTVKTGGFEMCIRDSCCDANILDHSAGFVKWFFMDSILFFNASKCFQEGLQEFFSSCDKICRNRRNENFSCLFERFLV